MLISRRDSIATDFLEGPRYHPDALKYVPLESQSRGNAPSILFARSPTPSDTRSPDYQEIAPYPRNSKGQFSKRPQSAFSPLPCFSRQEGEAPSQHERKQSPPELRHRAGPNVSDQGLSARGKKISDTRSSRYTKEQLREQGRLGGPPLKRDRRKRNYRRVERLGRLYERRKEIRRKLTAKERIEASHRAVATRNARYSRAEQAKWGSAGGKATATLPRPVRKQQQRQPDPHAPDLGKGTPDRQHSKIGLESTQLKKLSPPTRSKSGSSSNSLLDYVESLFPPGA